MPDPRPRLLLGGYYWFPSPLDDRTAWAVLTCHDLGFNPEAGHVDLWTAVVDRLAVAWERDAGGLRRRLVGRYTGLARGRVTRPGKTVLVLHGDDAPVFDWRERLTENFRLGIAVARSSATSTIGCFPAFPDNFRKETMESCTSYKIAASNQVVLG